MVRSIAFLLVVFCRLSVPAMAQNSLSSQTFPAAAEDTIVREGLIFFHLSGGTPLEGIFVGMPLDRDRSVWDQMGQLDERRDTGVLIPVFELGWSGIAYEAFLSQAVPFTNEATGERLAVLPVRLLFLYTGRLDGPLDDEGLCQTAIMFNNKKLLAVSRSKPAGWGVVVGLIRCVMTAPDSSMPTLPTVTLPSGP